jgi:hypothetical protein
LRVVVFFAADFFAADFLAAGLRAAVFFSGAGPAARFSARRSPARSTEIDSGSSLRRS